MPIKYIDQLDIAGKKVLIRVDYNVPYDKNLNITDETRILSTFDTLNYCIEKKCKIILVSHLGRPKGKVVPELTLEPVAKRLSWPGPARRSASVAADLSPVTMT